MGMVYTQSDIITLQRSVGAASTTLETASIPTTCTKLSVTQQSALGALYAMCTQYAADDPSWFDTGPQADQGEALMAQLEQWRQVVNAACGGVPVPFVVPKTSGNAIKDTIDSATTLLEVAIVAGVLVIIGKRFL